MNPPAVVVIPVAELSAGLAECLAALARQTVLPLAVLLADATGAVRPDLVQTLAGVPELPVGVLPLASGKGAAGALEQAAGMAPDDAVLLATTPYARVAPDWIEATLGAVAAGADVVAGRIVAAAADLTEERRFVERRIALLDQIASLLDPDPADPWPRHGDECFASLAITLDACSRFFGVGGTWPADSAVMAMLRRDEARIRHAPEVQVLVPGQHLPALEEPEGTDAAARRARLRRMARLVQAGRLPPAPLAAGLRLPRRTLSVWFGRGFGWAWQEIEAHSPVLQRRPVPPEDVPTQIERAVRLRDGLRAVTAGFDGGDGEAACQRTTMNGAETGVG